MTKKVLITGANGGFGKLTILELLKKGYQVVGTMRTISGRNADVTKELAKAGAQLVEMDVTKDDSVKSAVNKAIKMLGGIDIVINNAGVGVIGMQEHFTPDDLKYLFDVNVFGVQRVNREVLPHMRNQNSGVIVYISSLLGRITLPFYGPYNASKWALEALAENYRVELSGFGIESCIVEPGGFPTTFGVNLLTPSDGSRIESYGEFMNVPKLMGENFEKALANNPEQKPEKVSEAIVNLIETPKGKKPFRTVVDNMGMGDQVKSYNENLEKVTQGIFSAFGMEKMLTVN